MELGVPIPIGESIDLKCLLHSFFLGYMLIYVVWVELMDVLGGVH